MLKKIGIDWFILALLLLIVAAYFFPEIGTASKPINLTTIANYGISLIFFFYGAKLSKKQFLEGISNTKMHLIIQATTFIVFPLIALALKPFIDNQILWLSLLYLCVLPSTVSSSVVMVSIAKGNIPGAIFNATISSFAGVFFTPIIMSFFIKTIGIENSSIEILQKLFFQIILPIFIGMFSHKYIGAYIQKHKKYITYSDQTIILLVVFTTFCKSFSSNAFSQITLLQGFYLFLGIATIFLSIFFLLKYISKKLGFNYEDTITTIFCGSKKSLLHGVAIAKVLFGISNMAGILLLPIMMYHPLQLIFISFYARKKSKN